MLIVPLFAPVVPPVAVDGGANTTPMVQVELAFSVNVAVVGHVPAVVVERRKYAASVPPKAIEVPAMFGFPAGLASVTSVVVLTDPRDVDANAKLPGLAVALAMPVPVRFSAWFDTLPAATVTDAVRVPVALGVKVTTKVQLPPAATAPVQVLAEMTKSA